MLLHSLGLQNGPVVRHGLGAVFQGRGLAQNVRQEGNLLPFQFLSLIHILSAQQAEEAAQTALNVMAEYPLCFFSLDQLFNPSLWTLHSATPFVAVSNLSVTSSQESTPSQDYFAADTANPSAAVFWNCSFSGSTGHQLDLILDDETGKMLAFSYRIPATNTAEAAFSMEDAVQMRQFCQQYYNLDAAQFSALLPLYPPGYLLPFTDQKGEQLSLIHISPICFCSRRTGTATCFKCMPMRVPPMSRPASAWICSNATGCRNPW